MIPRNLTEADDAVKLILAPELLHRVTLFHSVAYALWYGETRTCGQGKTGISQLKAVILVTALAETHLL